MTHTGTAPQPTPETMELAIELDGALDTFLCSEIGERSKARAEVHRIFWERLAALRARSSASVGRPTEEAQGYADSLRQQAQWIREALDPSTPEAQRIDLGDIDTDELDAAAECIERTSASDAVAGREALPEWRDHVEQLEALTGDGDDTCSLALKAIVSILEQAERLAARLQEVRAVREALRNLIEATEDLAISHNRDMRIRAWDKIDAAQHKALVALANSPAVEAGPGAGRDDELTAKAAVAYLIDHIEYSDSYGVEGSDFQACLLCTGGGAHGIKLVHDETCPVRKCEAIATEWVNELNEAAVREELEPIYVKAWRTIVFAPPAAATAIKSALSASPTAAPGMEAREATFRALVQELFDFTTPVNDAGKFGALSSTMAESGWWKRAKAALALAPQHGDGSPVVAPAMPGSGAQ